MSKTYHFRFKFRFFRFLFTLIVLFSFIPVTPAQNQLKQYIDSALVNNQSLIQLQKQIQILNLGKKAIKASYQSPKGYLSSNISLTPYFNNNGKLFTSNPGPNAIGYDSRISNGELYSALMNVDVPLFAKKATQNALFKQSQLIEQLKTSYKATDLNIRRQVTDLYLNALSAQVSLKIQQKRIQLLSHEVAIMKTLTQKGMYRLVDYELIKTTLSGDSVQLQNLMNNYQIQLMNLRSACNINDSTLTFLQEQEININSPVQNNSIFLQPYSNDSVSAIADNLLFNNRYMPQVTLYTNAGLSAADVIGIGKRVGVSAGVKMTYTLFDGKQKQVNKEATMVKIDQAQHQKKLEAKQIRMQRAMLLTSISKARLSLQKQEKLKSNYKKLMNLYKVEVQKGQVLISSYLLALRNYNNLELNYELQKIQVYRLINEYNFWNH